MGFVRIWLCSPSWSSIMLTNLTTVVDSNYKSQEQSMSTMTLATINSWPYVLTGKARYIILWLYSLIWWQVISAILIVCGYLYHLNTMSSNLEIETNTKLTKIIMKLCNVNPFFSILFSLTSHFVRFNNYIDYVHFCFQTNKTKWVINPKTKPYSDGIKNGSICFLNDDVYHLVHIYTNILILTH